MSAPRASEFSGDSGGHACGRTRRHKRRHVHAHDHAHMYGLAAHPRWYDRITGLFVRPLYRRIAADVRAAGLPDGAVVVDVGTGPGRVPLLVAAECPGLSVHGIDLAPEMVEHASAMATAAGAAGQGVSFQVGDVVALPFADASVDLVVSSLSLHHWADTAAGLADIIRILRPGGEAWIYDVRPALREPEQLTAGLGVVVRLESHLVGWTKLRPIARLVLRSPYDPAEPRSQRAP